MAKFGKGDLVRLKSGGPVMAVDRYPGEASGHFKLSLTGSKQIKWTTYLCVWFDGNELKSAYFEEYLLVQASTKENEQ